MNRISGILPENNLNTSNLQGNLSGLNLLNRTINSVDLQQLQNYQMLQNLQKIQILQNYTQQINLQDQINLNSPIQNMITNPQLLNSLNINGQINNLNNLTNSNVFNNFTNFGSVSNLNQLQNLSNLSNLNNSLGVVNNLTNVSLTNQTNMNVSPSFQTAQTHLKNKEFGNSVGSLNNLNSMYLNPSLIIGSVNPNQNSLQQNQMLLEKLITSQGGLNSNENNSKINPSQAFHNLSHLNKIENQFLHKRERGEDQNLRIYNSQTIDPTSYENSNRNLEILSKNEVFPENCQLNTKLNEEYKEK